MAVGRPIIISVTRLDEAFYGRDAHPLPEQEHLGPDRDAESVRRTLFGRSLPGMREPIVLGTHAAASAPPTRANVINAIREAAADVADPDLTLFVYYAGHGTRFPPNAVG